MSFSSRAGRDLARGTAIAGVLVLVLAAALWWVLRDSEHRRITAYFTGAVGLYEGSNVRVLGVGIGQVDKVDPAGERVRVEMLVDRNVRVPADARAVVVAPSLVSDRYVQLTPAYSAGPEMESDAVIPRERTATPLEVDELYSSLTRVSRSLGPNGANSRGAVSDLLTTLQKNLAGNGQALNDTVEHLGEATRTLSESQEDLFGTVDSLQRFSTTLADSDKHVHQFSRQLADVHRFLAGERDELGAAVTQLSFALESVQGFIRDNRDKLKSNVDKLASISQVLVDQRAALAEVLDVAPLALSNATNTYNASAGTLDARPYLNELTKPPIVMVCDLLRQVTPNNMPQHLSVLCEQLAPVLKGLVPLPSAGQAITALHSGSLPLPLAGPTYGAGGGR